MIKSLASLTVLVLIAVNLVGCSPQLRSMGALVEIAPITHRADADSKDQQMQLDVTGFATMSDKAENVSGERALGGSASFTYRMGGGTSFLFVNAALSGFHGDLKFACTDIDCEENDSYYRKYQEWLTTDEAKKRYDFTNLQERLLVGFDFNPGYLILGFAIGGQAFQGGGSYDDKKAELASDSISFVEGEDRHGVVSPVVDDVDGRYGIGLTTVSWLGVRFGRQSQYGNLTFELSTFYKDGLGSWTSSFRLTYWHPSGFYGGIHYGDVQTYAGYIGKTFSF